MKELIPLLGHKSRTFTRLAPNSTQTYVASISGLAILTGAALVATGSRFENVWAIVALAVVAAVAEQGSVRLGKTTEQSISLLPMLFAAVLFGPLAAGLVGAASMLGDPELIGRASPGRSPRLKWASYTSSRFVSGAAMGGGASLAFDVVPSSFGGIVSAALVGALIGEALDVGFAALTARVRGTRTVGAVIRTHAPLILASAPLYAPVVAVLAVAYRDVSPWTMPLFFAPALAAQRLFSLYQQERRLAGDLSTANEHLEQANLSFAAALVATLDARDEYTAGHSAAVAIYSRDIATRLGLPAVDQQKAHLAGLVHDIGKVGLPPGLLEKEGPLTLEERRVMQTHSEIGERILSNVDDYADIALIVRHHHERVDGNGYPDHLTESETPLLARIIAVADAYNAMTSDRPYREAMPSRVARMRLAQAVGSQFDTAVVAAFEAILTTSGESYRLAQRPEFLLTERGVQTTAEHADRTANVA